MNSIGICLPPPEAEEKDEQDYALLVLKLNDMNFSNNQFRNDDKGSSDKSAFPLLKECIIKNELL